MFQLGLLICLVCAFLWCEVSLISFVYPQLREKIDAGLDVELNEDTNPHDVACLLKEFFRSLPEPLLTRDLYYPFLSTTSEC